MDQAGAVCAWIENCRNTEPIHFNPLGENSVLRRRCSLSLQLPLAVTDDGLSLWHAVQE